MRNRAKIYVALIALIMVLLFINVNGIGGAFDIKAANDYIVDENEWNQIIADSINDKTIKIQVDGKAVSEKDCSAYMNGKRQLMIAADSLTDVFQCAFRFYGEKKAVIEKGETKIVATLGSSYAEINDAVVTMSSKVENVDGNIYIPVDILTTGLGYTYTFDVQNNEAVFINTRSNEKSIPGKYDYRTDGRMSSIKNQGNHSTCWAFASLAALESSILPDMERDYSEKNMTLNSGYLVSLFSGGDYTMAMSYLAAWRGPILEEYEEGYGAYETPVDIKPDVHVQEIQIIKGKDLDAVKKAVFLYGGVETSIYMAIDAKNLDSYYYNKDNSAYCYVGIERPNHDVVIIGWDDNYAKENFNYEPEGNGAFICQNSWGEEFGEEGVFYVSYYDSNIAMNSLVYTGVEPNDNYDNIYQSDLCGFVGQLGYENEEAYFANVYTAAGNENLQAVSFYATDKNTEYEIYLVEDFKEASDLNNRYFVQKGAFVNAGYYTVNLDRAIHLEAGKKYAVVVKIKTPNAKRPIAIEYPASYETSNVDISDGEGYISYLGRQWERAEETQGCNICLKMFTNNID